MKKIVLTGPESSGKTTLAAQLAEYFGTDWVPEYARQHLEGLGRPYAEADLLDIARGQVALEEATVARFAEGPLFFDTSLEVLKIWSEVRFGRCHPYTVEQLRQRRPTAYLLCLPDLPWTPDPQRENPHDRGILLELYRRELTALGVPHHEVTGAGEVRLQNAASAVKSLLKI